MQEKQASCCLWPLRSTGQSLGGLWQRSRQCGQAEPIAPQGEFSRSPGSERGLWGFRKTLKRTLCNPWKGRAEGGSDRRDSNSEGPETGTVSPPWRG